LQRVIVEVSQKQLGQQEQLLLSSELDEVLKASKSGVSDEIFSLNREVFELLSKNNLLKNNRFTPKSLYLSNQTNAFFPTPVL
jgi:hypothetical protein